MLLSEGQMSDYKGAALMLNALPRAKELIGDKGYDADWFRHALAERGVAACIPSKSNRKVPIEHDRNLYRQRHRIENMFGRLKDWRRIHTRYDRCATTEQSSRNQRIISATDVADNTSEVSANALVNYFGRLPGTHLNGAIWKLISEYQRRS